jgi:S1-C subfamily serine protease
MTFRRRRHRLDPASALLVILLVMLCFAPAPAAADATGFFVSAEGHFVSAYHVLDNCAFAGIKTPDGVLIGVRVAGSAADDLAVVRVNRRPRYYGRLPKDPARALQNPVLIVRYPGSGDFAARRVTPAEYDGPDPFHRGDIRFLAAETIVGGNSGSPVLSQHGAVLGVLVARDVNRSYIGVAVDVFTLSRFLRDAGVDFETEAETAANRIGGDPDKAGRFTFPVTCLK